VAVYHAAVVNATALASMFATVTTCVLPDIKSVVSRKTISCILLSHVN
jgi:hypothetical protein